MVDFSRGGTQEWILFFLIQHAEQAYSLFKMEESNCIFLQHSLSGFSGYFNSRTARFHLCDNLTERELFVLRTSHNEDRGFLCYLSFLKEVKMSYPDNVSCKSWFRFYEAFEHLVKFITVNFKHAQYPREGHQTWSSRHP